MACHRFITAGLKSLVWDLTLLYTKPTPSRRTPKIIEEQTV